MGMAQKTKLKFKIKNIKVVERIIFFVLLGLIIFNVSFTVWSQKEKYFSFGYWQNFKDFEKAYYNSIYKNKKGTWLPDETLYSYISGALVKGKSPILLNPEVPPFGTYLIGFSILLLNNQHLIILFFAVTSLYVMYLLGKQIYASKITPVIPVFLFSMEPIFKNQLIYTPLLDIIQLFFILTTFYFFNKFISSKNNLIRNTILVNIFLGFFISTKFFGTGIAIVLAIIAALLINADFKRLRLFFITLPISILILYLTYIKVLIDGYPFNRFLGIQKWIFLYNQGHVTQPFSIWPLILFNKWYVWFGNKPVISDPQWLISWPIITIVSLVSIFKSYIQKIKKREVEVLFFWILAYFLMMSFVQATTRYFVILIPFLYLVSVYGIEQYIIRKIR